MKIFGQKKDVVSEKFRALCDICLFHLVLVGKLNTRGVRGTVMCLGEGRRGIRTKV
jgi:hypothetical protein